MVTAFEYIALVGAQLIGWLAGDRPGQRAVVANGGAITLLGIGTALAFPSAPSTIAGFAAAGLGVATLVPAATHEAD